MYKLLIVDDEFEIREGLKSFEWNLLNIEICGVCEHGLEALQFIEENPVDIVLSDIRMPIMDGLELTKRINHYYPYIFTIILTGYDDFEYVRSSMRNGALDYILKPFDIDEVTEVFKKITAKLKEKKIQQEKVESVERKNKFISTLLRKSFLKNLLNAPLSEEEIEENCSYSEMMLEAQFYTVCILKLDGVIQKEVVYSEKDWKLILFAFDNIVSEYNEENEFGYYWIEPAEGEIYLIILNSINEKVLRLLKDTRNKIYKIAGLIKTTISCSIGSVEKDIKQIITSAGNARIALEHVTSEESIIEYDKSMGETKATAITNENETIIDDIAVDSSKYIIETAVNYINKNYMKSITLEDVASNVYVNSAYFSYLFKQVTGINFINYLTNCRIKKAKELLKDPKYKIQYISEAVGYENPRYFSQIFKKYTGKTPYEYRSFL